MLSEEKVKLTNPPNKDLAARLFLFALFPLVGFLAQKFNPLNFVIPQSFYLKYFLINKMPAFAMILYALFIGCLRNNSKILKVIPDVTFLLIPLFLFYVSILDKTILIYGATDKPILYMNPKYIFISILVSYLYVRFNKKLRFKQTTKLSMMFAIMSIGIISYIGSFTIFDLRHPYNGNYLNWMVVLNPIVQSAFGKTIFVDQYSQYGGYGNFFKPIFSLVDPSILMITLIFSILLAICFFSLYCISTQLFQNYLFSIFILASSIYLEMYAFALWPGEKYFQVTPIRLVFPVLISVLVFYTNRLRHPVRGILYSFASAISLFWNLETGVVLVVALLCQMIYISTGLPKMIQNVCLYLISLMLFFVLFVGLLEQTSHKNFSIELFVRPLLIYGAGGALIFNKTWVLVFFIYGTGLIVGLRARKNAVTDLRRFDFLFFLSILSFGLMLYHMLRENQHDATLTPNIWSLPIILGMLLAFSIRGENRIMQRDPKSTNKKETLRNKYLRKKKLNLEKNAREKIKGWQYRNFRFRLNDISSEIIWSTSLFILVFLSFCLIGIQASTPVTSEVRIWQFGDTDSSKKLYARPLEGNLYYVTVSDQANGDKSSWEVRSDFAASISKKVVSHDLLILSEFDGLMYLSARSSTPAPWADWRHSGVITLPQIGKYNYEHEVVLAQLKSKEINRVVLDQYVGNMLPPFGVHTACNQCDEKLLQYITENFELIKTKDGGQIYNYYLKDGPNWTDSKLTYWERRK